jgi:hypothetical protein
VHVFALDLALGRIPLFGRLHELHQRPARKLQIRSEADSLADEPVSGELVSGQIPCYQGKKQGISQNP